MADVIDLSKHREAVYYKYSVKYAHEGRVWAFDLWAESEKDAWSRIQAIKHMPVEVDRVLEDRV